MPGRRLLMGRPGYERTRAWREAHPEYLDRERRRNAARQRALFALARLHHGDFERLYHDELVRAGLVQDHVA